MRHPRFFSILSYYSIVLENVILAARPDSKSWFAVPVPPHHFLVLRFLVISPEYKHFHRWLLVTFPKKQNIACFLVLAI